MSFLSPSSGSLTHLQQESYIPISEGILTDGVSSQCSQPAADIPVAGGKGKKFFENNVHSYMLQFLNQIVSDYLIAFR